MPSIAEQAVDVLRRRQIALSRGLSSAQLETIQARYELEFSAEHAEFLRLAVPRGRGWPRWDVVVTELEAGPGLGTDSGLGVNDGAELGLGVDPGAGPGLGVDSSADAVAAVIAGQASKELLSWLRRPVDGVLFDVLRNGFWPRSWGTRPVEVAAARAKALEFLAAVPVLIPVYGHRYLPSGRGRGPAPVLSVVQTDVVEYGRNLADYVGNEFGGRESHRDAVVTNGPPTGESRVRVPFWSALAAGAGDSDL
ncbi:hypothetical protein M6D93_05865 [Jatrophihabitans telluris]|uniref:SMI1/KNR4 family protein n=1 Tax=Jatrophihabitans telluris TaxID=2038343 RepID=A0ABY4R2H3_9ACTN|nr:hypothetical protein [Jatrophihabitans telluris]UQX89532.1 hypothetical protein M6D93_05865 [Jatrophihabitans telluris]